MPPIHVKGKREPVDAYVLLALADVTGTSRWLTATEGPRYRSDGSSWASWCVLKRFRTCLNAKNSTPAPAVDGAISTTRSPVWVSNRPSLWVRLPA